MAAQVVEEELVTSNKPRKGVDYVFIVGCRQVTRLDNVGIHLYRKKAGS